MHTRARSRTLVPGAWGAWAAVAVVTVAVAWWMWPTSALSWHFFPDGATALGGDSGLHLYADHPEYQIGPVAFGVAWLLTPLGSTGGLCRSGGVDA